ncbi:MAG: hypothetical protein JBO36_15425 [Candidatus Thiodiazotropha taylori]|nr:hypothetical protein [Candidatus Thiodiazotropha taylori]
MEIFRHQIHHNTKLLRKSFGQFLQAKIGKSGGATENQHRQAYVLDLERANDTRKSPSPTDFVAGLAMVALADGIERIYENPWQGYPQQTVTICSADEADGKFQAKKR